MPLNNTRILKFKAQLTYVFFAIVDQMFGGFSQLLTSDKRAVMKSQSTVQTTKQCSRLVGSGDEAQNISDGSKKQYQNSP